MTTKTIAIDRLREMGASKGTLGFLSDRFGDSVTINEESAVSCAEDIDWKWASENLLDEDQRALYKEARDLHWRAYREACIKHLNMYDEACDKHLNTYNEACDKHLKAYEEACDNHWKEYQEVRDKHWKEYEEVRDTHLKACEEACAKAFVTAYYTK